MGMALGCGEGVRELAMLSVSIVVAISRRVISIIALCVMSNFLRFFERMGGDIIILSQAFIALYVS